MTEKRVPRGIRNNNPMNIIKTKNARWIGLSADQPDGTFLKFEEMVYGYRAGIIIITKTYYNRGWSNIDSIITHYAPSTENNTEAYIRGVVKRLRERGYPGISRHSLLPRPSVTTAKLWIEIVIAIHNIENENWPYDLGTIQQAFDMVFNNESRPT